ncbi:MAG TPA: NAD(P)H-dependent glycerol-3-phosphate dehydrogenase [candidate division Zixibacteria bacterium]|nr:NAD(P)H-dependent glycerol-3-phosphate dehydrogenase [candidate division Zixibacteria bacterium]
MSQAIAVIGAGGWGIALAKLLAEKGMRVTLWCHGADTHRELAGARESRTYLPGVRLPDDVELTRDAAAAARGKSLVICAVPSHAVREVLEQAAPGLDRGTTLLCATKGLEEGSLKTMGELMAEILGEGARERHAFLSGPTFAAEVGRGLPAAVTAAAYRREVARAVQETLSTQNFRVYTSTDVIGVQMGGVVKNVIAIAAGISDGLGLGHNARAALITRGLAELTRLAVRMGADPATTSGLAGLGDLVLTCTGELSRNRKVGVLVAQGKSLEEIMAGTRMVAEGVRNTRSVRELASRLSVEMPIVDQMYRVLYEGKPPALAVRDLMKRSLKPENSLN